MKKANLFSALAICAVALTACSSDDDINGSTVPQTAVNPETMYQIATLQSLMIGNYDGFIPVGELRKFGNFGLGTFDAVDGEMIVLDGTVYQARYDGSVNIAHDAIGVPFATVTSFDTDITQSLGKVENMQQLVEQLTSVVENNGRNLIYAVRIDVNNCESILVRSELPQTKPYRPLAEALSTDQREFSYHNIGGTVVAVYFPSFFTSQNTPGWHCHFISADRTRGGHMLDIRFSAPALAQYDVTSYYNMFMPSEGSFSQGDLSRDLSGDIDKVEK